jgi:hypothetical protein
MLSWVDCQIVPGSEEKEVRAGRINTADQNEMSLVVRVDGRNHLFEFVADPRSSIGISISLFLSMTDG